MDEALLARLRCPVSGGALELDAIEVEHRGGRRLVRTGLLTCADSHLWYPVINHVPVMLTFPTRLADRFARDHAEALRRHDGLSPPCLEPMPGERSVQKTFTEEWRGLGDDELTFVYTDDQLRALHREVWLHLPPGGDPGVASVLDVGCGFGREASILCDIFPNAEVIGVDLNLALLSAAGKLADNARLHLVIASLFRLPFAAGSIDHVHCQGVLHHTFSTERAFQAIARLVGGRGALFTWVYGVEDSRGVGGWRGLMVRLYWLVSHRIGRPVLSRAPGVLRTPAIYALSALLHGVLKARSRGRRDWRFRNTVHGLRDAFTPRYAHQHRFEEVSAWYASAGFSCQSQSPARYEALMGQRLLGIGILGRRGGEAAAAPPGDA